MALKPIYGLEDKLGFGKKIIQGKCVKDMTIKELLNSGTEGYGYVAWCLNDVQGFKLSNKAYLYAKLKETTIILGVKKEKAKEACRVNDFETSRTFPSVEMGEYGALEHELRGDFENPFDDFTPDYDYEGME